MIKDNKQTTMYRNAKIFANLSSTKLKNKFNFFIVTSSNRHCIKLKCPSKNKSYHWQCACIVYVLYFSEGEMMPLRPGRTGLTLWVIKWKHKETKQKTKKQTLLLAKAVRAAGIGLGGGVLCNLTSYCPTRNMLILGAISSHKKPYFFIFQGLL